MYNFEVRLGEYSVLCFFTGTFGVIPRVFGQCIFLLCVVSWSTELPWFISVRCCPCNSVRFLRPLILVLMAVSEWFKRRLVLWNSNYWYKSLAPCFSALNSGEELQSFFSNLSRYLFENHSFERGWLNDWAMFRNRREIEWRRRLLTSNKFIILSFARHISTELTGMNGYATRFSRGCRRISYRGPLSSRFENCWLLRRKDGHSAYYTVVPPFNCARISYSFRSHKLFSAKEDILATLLGVMLLNLDDREFAEDLLPWEILGKGLAPPGYRL